MMRFKRNRSYAASGPEAGPRQTSSGYASTALDSNKRRSRGKIPADDRGWSAEANTGMRNTSVSQLPIEVDVDPLLKDIIFSEDLEQKKLVIRLYRDIYYSDSVCGSSVDMLSTLPFSDFTLGGVTDKRAMRAFQETIERLNCRTALPHISTDHLVDGAHISSLLFNRTSRRFFDMMPHRNDNAKIDSMPFYGQDPIITVAIPDNVRQVLGSDSVRVQRLRERLGGDIINLLQQEALELDPLSTVYIPRKTFTSGEGVSFFRRVLPIYLIEKNLFRGTLVESSRRQRGILHLQLGDGEQWEPTIADMEFMTELFMCLTGDTLVHTDEGLRRIDSICSRDGMKKDTGRDIKLRVKGADGKMSTATKWWYRGFAPVMQVTSEYGYRVRATEDHRIYVLGENGPEWKRMRDVSTSDFLCVDVKKLKHKKRPLNWGTVEKHIDDSQLSLPKYMTEELSYALGLLMAEGSLDSYRFRLGNTDTGILDKFVDCMSTVGFDLHYEKCHRQKKGSEVTINGVTSTRKHHYYEIRGGNSRTFIRYLRNIGVTLANSHEKEIPKAILEATQECQAAFLAGMIDGDGTLVSGMYRVYSRSSNMLVQLQSMLSNMGLLSCVNEKMSFISLSVTNSQALSVLISDHIACDRKKLHRSEHLCRKSGIPTNWIVKELKSRYIEHVRGIGVLFHNDEGKTVLIEGIAGGHNRFFNSVLGRTTPQMFLREGLKTSQYEAELKAIRRISKRLYVALMELVKAEYVFSRVTTIESQGKDHVYDLTIAPDKKPAFIANGVLVHNSADADPLGAIIATRLGVSADELRQGGDFWKVTDIWDTTAMFKLRAMGISESFLSGEANYATADTSLTVFIESIRAFRDMLTRKLFYNKIFPLVSLVNGFTVNDRGKLIRKDGLLDSDNMQVNLDKLANGSRLLIPNVHWAKQLKPEGDTQYLDMLQQLTDKGVPVPLRALAAAGGFNLDSLLSDADDDLDMLRRVSDYGKQVQEIKKKYGPKADDGSGGMGGFASSGQADLRRELENFAAGTRSSVLAQGTGRRPVRTFGEESEIVGRTRTGKKKYVRDQRGANDKANRAIAKALAGVTRNKRTPLTHATVTSQSGKDKPGF